MKHHDRHWMPFGLLAALVAASGSCSSSDDAGAGGSPGTAADSGAEAAVDEEPVVEGKGAACTPHSHEVLGIKLALDVNWPASPGTMGCEMSDHCSGTVNIWLLSQMDVSGQTTTGTQMGTGTTTMCGNQTPTITLTQLGTEGEGVTSGSAKVSIQFLPSVWDAVATNPSKAPVHETGVIGGWNVGSSFKVDATVASFGLNPSSPLASATATWPASQSGISSSDIADDDNDGHPGITATPSSMDGNSLPATGLATSAPFAPQADKLYVVLRTVLSFYGLGTSCTEVSGKATATLFNDHVIGCHVQGGGDCTQTQWDFIDQISTVYVGDGVTIPPGVAPPSFAPAGMTGTFTAKVLSNDPGAGGIDCAAVRSALP